MYRYRDWLITQVMKKGKGFFLDGSVLKSRENCQTKIQISHCAFGPKLGNAGDRTGASQLHGFRPASDPAWASASCGRKHRRGTKALSQAGSALTFCDPRRASPSEHGANSTRRAWNRTWLPRGPLETESRRKAQDPRLLMFCHLLTLLRCVQASICRPDGPGLQGAADRGSGRSSVRALDAHDPSGLVLVVVLVFGHGDGGGRVTPRQCGPEAQSQSSRTAPAGVSQSQL